MRDLRNASEQRADRGKNTVDRRRRFTIKVGCKWNAGSAPLPKALRTSIRSAVEAAAVRLRTKHGRPFRADDVAEIRAIRGSAGRSILEAVIEDIRESDLLVFDISPHVGQRHGQANVLLELGIALGLGKQLIICSDATYDPAVVCSDLLGVYVASLKGGSLDRSAQMTITNALLRFHSGTSVTRTAR